MPHWGQIRYAAASASLAAASGTYHIGTVPISMTFSNSVTVSGTPTLALSNGKTASYTSGSGSATLIFTYTITHGDSSSNLDAASTTALDLNDGAILDSSSKAVKVTVPVGSTTGSLATNANVVIAAIGPTCTLTTPTSATVATAFTLTATFSASVTGFDASDITVTNGTLSNFSGSGTTYTATITPSSAGTLAITVPDAAALDGSSNPNFGSSVSMVVSSASTSSESSDGGGGGGGCGLGSGVALAGMLLAALSWMRLRRRQAA